MEQSILRSDVMKLIDNGDEFDMTFITADRKRGTGGELIDVKGWTKMNVQDPIEVLPGRFRRKARTMIRNPNHWEHKTINICNPTNSRMHPHKVHFRLIQIFNSKRVLNG